MQAELEATTSVGGVRNLDLENDDDDAADVDTWEPDPVDADPTKVSWNELAGHHRANDDADVAESKERRHSFHANCYLRLNRRVRKRVPGELQRVVGDEGLY